MSLNSTTNHIKRFYLCGRYGRKAELRKYADELRNMGHIVTSSWLDSKDNMDDCELTDEEKHEIALEDINDLLEADVVIVFSEEENSAQKGRGGRHIETGIAMCHSKEIIVIGPKENIFHYIKGAMNHCESWEYFIDLLQRANILSSILMNAKNMIENVIK